MKWVKKKEIVEPKKQEVTETFLIIEGVFDTVPIKYQINITKLKENKKDIILQQVKNIEEKNEFSVIGGLLIRRSTIAMMYLKDRKVYKE